jgi:hypothetical protein
MLTNTDPISEAQVRSAIVGYEALLAECEAGKNRHDARFYRHQLDRHREALDLLRRSGCTHIKIENSTFRVWATSNGGNDHGDPE